MFFKGANSIRRVVLLEEKIGLVTSADNSGIYAKEHPIPLYFRYEGHHGDHFSRKND